MSRVIWDLYDDPTGSVLRAKIPNPENLPEAIKTAERLTPEAHERLPDHVFALVAQDGEHSMRKFACIDEGNTLLNVIYLIEQHTGMPEPAVKTAAANLRTACGWYNIKPPQQLDKLAACSSKKPLLKEKKKEGELVGSHSMPYSIGSEKRASAVMYPYVDITGHPPMGKEEPPKEYGNFCLEKQGEKRFPIDTEGQVKTASAYFVEHWRGFEPFDRHQYCVKLAQRAQELGVDVPEMVQKYGSLGYAPDVEGAVYARTAYCVPGSREHLFVNRLLEKRAELTPEEFAVALERFDRDTGIWNDWGGRVGDPYYSTFGFDKYAGWSFEEGGRYIDEETLHNVLKERRKGITDLFGKEILDGLDKDPIGIFESLPMDMRKVIMNMGSELT